MKSTKGEPIGGRVRKLGITEQTYCRWRKQYGGLKMDQALRLKRLEKDNARLRKLVAEPLRKAPGPGRSQGYLEGRTN